SWAPTSPFFSSLNCTTRVTMPSRVVERSSSTPEIWLMASSMGLVTVVSISPALAPGREAVTETTGKSTFGNRSTPRPKYATSPSRTGPATRTHGKIGRRMQTSETFMRWPPSWLDAGGDAVRLARRRPDGHGDVGGQGRLAAGDDQRAAR